MMRFAGRVLFFCIGCTSGCASTHTVDDVFRADRADAHIPEDNGRRLEALCPGASFETMVEANTYCTYSWPNASCPALTPNTKTVRIGTLCSNAPFPEVPAAVCEQLATYPWVWDQGALRTTDWPSDISVQGADLFIGIEDPKKGIALTRAGRLLLNNTAHLFTVYGQRVLFRQLRGDEFVAATIAEDAVELSFNSTGELIITHADESQSTLGRIALARVDDPTRLTRIGSNTFVSPTAIQWLSYNEQPDGWSIVSGALEEQWDFCE